MHVYKSVKISRLKMQNYIYKNLKFILNKTPNNDQITVPYFYPSYKIFEKLKKSLIKIKNILTYSIKLFYFDSVSLNSAQLNA